MRFAVVLVLAQLLSLPVAMGVASLSDGRAQYGLQLALIGLPVLLALSALVEVPVFRFVLRRCRSGYTQFSLAGLALGAPPAVFLYLAGGGIASAATAAAWFVCTSILFRSLIRLPYGLRDGT